jgi:hypothetical protein
MMPISRDGETYFMGRVLTHLLRLKGCCLDVLHPRFVRWTKLLTPSLLLGALRDSRQLNCPRDDRAREIVDGQITWLMVTFRAYHLLPLRPALLHGGCQIRNQDRF